MSNSVKQEQNRGKAISLRDLWHIFTERWWIMLLAAIIVMIGMFLIVKVTYTPEYQCKATLYILKRNDEATGSSSDFSVALNVVKDCTYILKCHSVLDAVISVNDLDIEYKKLYNRITTKNPDGTRILEVTAKAPTPELAKKIVDSVCLFGTDKITESLGFKQTSICEEGIYDPMPCNRIGFAKYLLFGLLAAIAVYSVFFLIFILDDRISDNEEIEKILGLSVLGEVPDFNDEAHSKYGQRSYGKHYYVHKSSKSKAAGEGKR